MENIKDTKSRIKIVFGTGDMSMQSHAREGGLLCLTLGYHGRGCRVGSLNRTNGKVLEYTPCVELQFTSSASFKAFLENVEELKEIHDKLLKAE